MPSLLHKQLKTVVLEAWDWLLLKGNLQAATLKYYKALMKFMLIFKLD